MLRFENWTEQDVLKYYSRINKKVPKIDFNSKEDKLLDEEKKSKYNAQKTIVDNIEFDSEKESKRYKELKYLEKAGMIKDLQLQVPFELQPKFTIER